MKTSISLFAIAITLLVLFSCSQKEYTRNRIPRLRRRLDDKISSEANVELPFDFQFNEDDSTENDLPNESPMTAADVLLSQATESLLQERENDAKTIAEEIHILVLERSALILDILSQGENIINQRGKNDAALQKQLEALESLQIRESLAVVLEEEQVKSTQDIEGTKQIIAEKRLFDA